MYCQDYENSKFELGVIPILLGILFGEKAIKKSVFLQEFNNYIRKMFVYTLISDEWLLSEIDRIKENYRNKTAHSYPTFGYMEAKKCGESVYKMLNYIIDSMEN